MVLRSASDRTTVINALRIAARAYREAAKTMVGEDLPRLVQQFERQAADADRIVDQVEQES